MGGMNFSDFSKGLKNTKTLATTDNENLSLGAFFRLPARSLVVDIRVVINMTFESMTQLQTMGINRTTSSSRRIRVHGTQPTPLGRIPCQKTLGPKAIREYRGREEIVAQDRLSGRFWWMCVLLL